MIDCGSHLDRRLASMLVSMSRSTGTGKQRWCVRRGEAA